MTAKEGLMAELIWEGKYDSAGRRVAPLRVALPFQTVETVNESAQERQKVLDLFASGRAPTWRNRLVWGDKKYVLPALVEEFAGAADLIYIDPPFATGADFSLPIAVGEGDEEFTKLPSLIEVKAYRDTWSRASTRLDSYLGWFYETVVLLHDLLASTGTIYVHLDWHAGHYAKVVLDEVFGRDGFLNEIVWQYKAGAVGSETFGRKHDVLFRYAKTPGAAKFNADAVRIPYAESTIQRLKYAGAREKNVQKVLERGGKVPTDVWDIGIVQGNSDEFRGYPTQKPEALLERIIKASSDPDDLVLDVFCGSGTTAAVAERLGRRWVVSDLSRFAIHTTRKRLLDIGNVRPFVVQNLGKYERQLWQRSEFSEDVAERELRYRDFILHLYGATAVKGHVWLHGLRSGRMVHVGAVDAPVSPSDVKAIVAEFKRVIGSGEGSPTKRGLDVLGWDFAFEINEIAKQHAEQAGIDLRMHRIPREVMDRRAVDAGDVQFFELAALDLEQSLKGRAVAIELKRFVIPIDDVPEDVRKMVSDWTEWVDYWAIDWDFREDTFHNQWQTYRTRAQPRIERRAGHTYEHVGTYTIVVKVVDILGNDTTRALTVSIK